MLFGVIILMPMLFFTAEGVDKKILICPSETLNREQYCPNGAFIDVIRATAAYLGGIYNETNQCNKGRNSMDLVDNINNASCKIKSPFLRCHGRHSCILNGRAANVSLPHCGRYSDIIDVTYDCYKSEASVMLPSTNDVTWNKIDVFSPGFPDVTEEGRYDVTCSITPRVIAEQRIKLTIVAKLISIDGVRVYTNNSACKESLQFSLSGESFFCYQEISRTIRNDNLGKRTGHNWTLKYRSDGTVKHKFWIQLNATEIHSNEEVDMTISCADNLRTTTTTEQQNNDLTIGVSAGAALLVAIFVVIVVVVFYIKRKRRNKNQPDGPLHPSVPQSNVVSKPYCIVSVITPTPANSHDTNNAVPRQAPRSAKGEEMNRIEYADVVVVPSGENYVQFNKKYKANEVNVELKNRNILDGETIMEENTELYAKEVVPLNKMAKNEEKNPQHLEE